jgi:hypothetical protein
LRKREHIVLCAVLDRAQLNRWVAIPDEALVASTGLSRVTIWRARERLMVLNFFACSSSMRSNSYMLNDEHIQNIIKHAQNPITPFIAQKLTRLPQDVRPYAEVVYRHFGFTPRFSWTYCFRRLSASGVSVEKMQSLFVDAEIEMRRLSRFNFAFLRQFLLSHLGLSSRRPPKTPRLRELKLARSTLDQMRRGLTNSCVRVWDDISKCYVEIQMDECNEDTKDEEVRL